MEVFLTDAATGVTHAVDIGMDEKPERLKLEAGEAFRYPDGVEEEDVHLLVGGKAVCDDEPLSQAGVEAGCVVHVTLCPGKQNNKTKQKKRCRSQKKKRHPLSRPSPRCGAQGGEATVAGPAVGERHAMRSFKPFGS